MIVTCENCTSRFVVDPKVLQPRGRRVRCARCKAIWFQAPPEAGSAGDADMRGAGQQEERRQVFQRSQPAAASDNQEVFGTAGAESESAAEAPPGDTPEAAESEAADTPNEDAQDAGVEADEAGPVAGPGAGDDAADSEDEDMAALYGTDDSSDDDMTDLPWGKPKRNRKSQVPALYKKRSPVLAVAGWAAVVAMILSAVGTAIFARETIVAKVPVVKPVYAAVGLGIEPKIITEDVAQYLNIETPPPQPAYWRDDQLIQEITGTIINTADAPVRVPPLEGILRDRDNNELYRWLFAAETDILYPGQRASFATEIVDLPQEAAEMQVVFTDGRTPAPIAGSQSGAAGSVENSR